MKIAIIISLGIALVSSGILIAFDGGMPYAVLILFTISLNSMVALIGVFNNDDKNNIIFMEEERLEWSLKIFTEATPQSSLEKLKEEIKEIEVNLAIGKKDPVEYADATMCLWDSAGRDGIGLEDIFKAFKSKLKINKERTWKKNPDNSYSHIK